MGVTIFVTGAGGPAGVSVIRALRRSGCRVIAGDADATAVGLRLAHESCVVPRADAIGFATTVFDLAHRQGADALISTVAEELEAIARDASTLGSHPVHSWLPSHEAIVLCNDKLRFARALAAAKVPAPLTALSTSEVGPPPWIVKPRRGRGSRGVSLATTAAEANAVLMHTPDAIVQSVCRGREFTADVLVDRDGQLAACVPRWRVETKAGISTKGETFSHAGVRCAVGRALAAVGLTGPANVQGFVDDDGRVEIVEINPRFSGGLALSLAAGADLTGEYTRAILGLPLRPERLTYRTGVRMFRFYDEIFEEDS